jgi:hypothetical protein
MGEYANLQIRADIKKQFGFDPGDMDDERKAKNPKAPVRRVKCPHCPAHLKEVGLAQHIKDVHKELVK